MNGEGDGAITSEIVAYYEEQLERYGDEHRGVAWPNAAGARTRYEIMLDLVRSSGVVCADPPPTLLDFGCGAAHLLDHLGDVGNLHLRYTGIDRSQSYIDLCQAKYPANRFWQMDVLDAADELPRFDFVVMNGVLTVRAGIDHDSMWEYAQRLLRRCFTMAEVGLAFNVMTKHLDWERDDLFHVGFDAMASFVRRDLSRHFRFRQDYGLYEYTTYVYRSPIPV